MAIQVTGDTATPLSSSFRAFVTGFALAGLFTAVSISVQMANWFTTSISQSSPLGAAGRPAQPTSRESVVSNISNSFAFFLGCFGIFQGFLILF